VAEGARAVSQGKLDQVVPATTKDELGELGQAFNTMARTIREYREAGTVRLLRAQKTAQATIDSFPDPVIVVDPQGGVERANPAARRLLQAIPTTSGDTLPWIAPAALQAQLDSVLGGQADYLPLSLEQAIFLRDGNQDRYFLPRVLRIRSDSGELLGAAVVLSDVTKFHLLDQLKSDMISTVSHELKTPLTSLQMVVHLLLEEAIGPLTTKQTELLLAARQDSDRLLGMINDLLDLTRIEQGRVALDQQPADAAELVRDALERYRSAAEDAGIALQIQLEAPLPQVLVDKERIEHVFDNLMTNALRHTDRGGTIILRAAADGGTVQFSVADTGEGIPVQFLPRVFDKFFRTPGAKHQGGAGLGLAIVHEIIVSHGGQIGVQSTLGKGTTFTFSLSAAAAAQDEAATGSPDLVSSSSTC
jgi:signal transduction histidine kinase